MRLRALERGADGGRIGVELEQDANRGPAGLVHEREQQVLGSDLRPIADRSLAPGSIDRVLRPALVAVAGAPTEPAAADRRPN